MIPNARTTAGPQTQLQFSKSFESKKCFSLVWDSVRKSFHQPFEDHSKSARRAEERAVEQVSRTKLVCGGRISQNVDQIQNEMKPSIRSPPLAQTKSCIGGKQRKSSDTLLEVFEELLSLLRYMDKKLIPGTPIRKSSYEASRGLPRIHLSNYSRESFLSREREPSVGAHCYSSIEGDSSAGEKQFIVRKDSSLEIRQTLHSEEETRVSRRSYALGTKKNLRSEKIGSFSSSRCENPKLDDGDDHRFDAKNIIFSHKSKVKQTNECRCRCFANHSSDTMASVVSEFSDDENAADAESVRSAFASDFNRAPKAVTTYDISGTSSPQKNLRSHDPVPLAKVKSDMACGDFRRSFVLSESSRVAGSRTRDSQTETSFTSCRTSNFESSSGLIEQMDGDRATRGADRSFSRSRHAMSHSSSDTAEQYSSCSCCELCCRSSAI